ncbi:MAG: outer membrane beta-barrel protein [Dysgonamonadaceae bacterium]|jgi:hypothetical protein|nr:outer membrane beta-barrel protein [Dysgonamonadaceae bacterium]
MKRVLVLSIFLMSVAVIAQAQFQQFHVGAAFPSGKFADGNEKTESIYTSGKGFAATGITAGYKLYNMLSVENMSWVFGIEIFFNPINSDLKDVLEKDWKDITPLMYFNFPVTFGLNYAIPLNGEKMKLYGEAAIGANFSMLTDFVFENNKNNTTTTRYANEKISTTPLFGFTYGLEVGLFINSKYSIGLRHNNLGSYKYKYEEEYESKSNIPSLKGKFDKALPITITSLTVGVLF